MLEYPRRNVGANVSIVFLFVISASWARLGDRNWRRRAVDHLIGDEQQRIED